MQDGRAAGGTSTPLRPGGDLEVEREPSEGTPCRRRGERKEVGRVRGDD